MTNLIVANWKMYTTYSDAIVLANQIARLAEKIGNVEIVLCPPAVWIYAVREALYPKPRHLKLGLQNFYPKSEGPYTGEISLNMVKGLVQYAIVGHSERRLLFGETDELVNQKVKLALSLGITPIICVGEHTPLNLKENYQAEVKKLSQKGGVLDQVSKALEGISPAKLEETVISYEPVWAIGTGRPATGAYANEIIRLIRVMLSDLTEGKIGSKVRILYGGSVTAGNVSEFLYQPEINGALVGGASLKAGEFIKICRIAAEDRKY